jgi:aspartate racemase
VNPAAGKCLGLIGGLGVGSTVHYYQQLAKAHEALQLLIIHADMRRVFGHARAGDAAGLAQYLAGLIEHLHAGGAQIAAVSAVMPHLCIEELIPLSPLPVVNILQAIGEELKALGIRRVAVFGTRFTMESRLFGVKGVEIITPAPAEIAYIHETYFQLASQGQAAADQREGLTRLAKQLCQQDGAEAIVLAGTDFAVAFNESNTDFPHVDCAQVHVRAILRALGD